MPRTLSTTELSREGNDCYIYESLTLVEELDLYFTIKVKKVTGWASYESATIDYYPTKDINQAIKDYKAQGGVYEAMG